MRKTFLYICVYIPSFFRMFPNVLLMHIIFYIITCNGIFLQMITKEKGILIHQKFRPDFELWVEHLVLSYL